MLTDDLSKAIVELDEDRVKELVNIRLEAGLMPLDIVSKLQEGMTEVGKRFETGEYFLSELIMAGEIMKERMVDLEPRLADVNSEHRGTIVIGTVKDDIHDLGKEIVVMLLKGSGYNVIDLGVDVPAEKFVDAIRQNKAPLLALSVLLTSCVESMKKTIDTVRASGLDVKILIGGAIVDDKVKEFCGPDYGSTIASDAVKIAEEVFGKVS
ncbi:MAG: 5-methyltetrahydrofolate--homocysteine methyltransferase [Geosporobacter ferrireducens]|nr:5-methyltetrahydrofolate--homocysteine methyltransferase [Geosporobacter ferrireducens]